MESKICAYCTEPKLTNQFKRMKTKTDGRSDFCIDCNLLLLKLPTLEDRKKFHLKCRLFKYPQAKYDRMTHYQLSEEKYQQLLTEQKNLCAICKQAMEPPCIDHCHTSLKVRGLLCRSCNAGLGMFKDSIESLSAAIAYLS